VQPDVSELEPEERKTTKKLEPKPNARKAKKVFAEPVVTDRAARQAKREQKVEEEITIAKQNTNRYPSRNQKIDRSSSKPKTPSYAPIVTLASKGK